jgi:hypothetical protein
MAQVTRVHRVTCNIDSSDGGGGDPPPGVDSPGPTGGDGVSWWPEFERELARYLAERDAAQQRAEGGPAVLAAAPSGAQHEDLAERLEDVPDTAAPRGE